jgi:methylated-DNA-[protein]-cysteine S-methyltransferase
MGSEIIHYKSPIGTIKITGSDNGIESVVFIEETIQTSKRTPKFLQPCLLQLQEYFLGIRKDFDLKLHPEGTDFQYSVWEELEKIPFGKTRSYMEQTKALGNIKAIRAVASANGKNPISIIIPCHRVIGSDGSLTGYAGGIWRKKWLLEHENPNRQISLF